GQVRRRKALHDATFAVMLDDVGEDGTKGVKVSWLDLEVRWGLSEPSYALETSPGNWQLGLLLKEPETRRWAVEQLLSGMVNPGLAIDGDAPGMTGVTRYGRLPIGWNNKAKHVRKNGGEPWRHRLTIWDPDRRYTVEELAEMFGVTLVEPQAGQGVRAENPAEWPDDPV